MEDIVKPGRPLDQKIQRPENPRKEDRESKHIESSWHSAPHSRNSRRPLGMQSLSRDEDTQKKSGNRRKRSHEQAVCRQGNQMCDFTNPISPELQAAQAQGVAGCNLGDLAKVVRSKNAGVNAPGQG